MLTHRRQCKILYNMERQNNNTYMAMITNASIALYCQEIDLEAMKILNLCYERAKEVCMLYSSVSVKD